MAYRSLPGVDQASSIHKPGTLSLLRHILKGAVTNGMQLPAILGISTAIAFHQGEFPYHETVAGMIILGLLLTGLARGAAAWQRDMVKYRRDKLLSRHRQSRSNLDYTIPGFYSANNRY
jgi:hypothetical protein